MNGFMLCVVVQVCLMFGMAGIFWPEKFMSVFDVLMYPWAATHKGVRANGVAAIALSVLLLLGMVVGAR